jgi:carbamoyltransferase
MRTLGINISHNASICQVTDGKIDFYYEEDRFNKRKYYAPKHDDCYFKVIDEKVKDKPDNVIVAAYDRAFLGETKETLISDDIICCDLLSKQLKQQVHFYKSHHHLYHAYTGFHLSPFDEAIVVVMDGGGGQEFHCYQEIETVYLMNKKNWQRKYLHASCIRFDERYGLIKSPDREFKINDEDVLLSSRKSMGYLFADMCTEMGFKHNGLDAGKLMGLASYPEQKKPHALQEHSKNYTIDLLKKAFSYSDCKNVILSGGYSLNCVNNYHYVKEFPEYNFFVDPVAHDGGTAIGAALWMNEQK